MRGLVVAIALVGCRSGTKPPPDPVAQQCIDAVDRLGPDLAPTEQRLRGALARDRGQAAQLLRDSVEIVLVTRELLCAQADPSRVRHAVERLEATRRAFDALLVATSSPQAPVDEAALVDRFSRALTAPAR